MRWFGALGEGRSGPLHCLSLASTPCACWVQWPRAHGKGCPKSRQTRVRVSLSHRAGHPLELGSHTDQPQQAPWAVFNSHYNRSLPLRLGEQQELLEDTCSPPSQASAPGCSTPAGLRLWRGFCAMEGRNVSSLSCRDSVLFVLDLLPGIGPGPGKGLQRAMAPSFERTTSFPSTSTPSGPSCLSGGVTAIVA